MNISSLRERDKSIINNWYIACLSIELKSNKALARTIYDKSYVLFRSKDNSPTCLLNRCLHRLTQLDTGVVKDGNLSCPYHGWKYNSNGDVIEVPSESLKEPPKRKLCNKALPCVEQDGVIWVWMGNSEPTTEKPSWRFPFYDDSNWVNYFMITDFDNEVTNLCENFMDVPHTVFVHKSWFRNKSFTKVPMTVETKDATVLVTYNQKKDKIGGFFNRLLNPKGEDMLHTDEYIYPNLTRVDYTFGNKHGFIINSQNTPVSSLKSRTYTYISYRVAFGSTFIKPFMKFYTRKVIEQDVEIMKIQSKSLEIDPTLNFQSTEADALHVEIEKLRKWGEQDNKNLLEYKNTISSYFWI
jgi:phenylpropionate dioxygenase-like ring-hydroxylating dioxygenase large terminal subunit